MLSTSALKFNLRRYSVGTDARLMYLHGIAVDGDGNVFVADLRNRRIRQVTPDGTVTTLAGRD
jgi:sugar lactone lactonase YvrE